MNCSLKNNRWLITGILILLIVILLTLFTGNEAVDSASLFRAFIKGGSAPGTASLILFGVRIPRLTAGIFCGIALSVSGYLLQKALNNQLAAPGIMGINNGAGLFALLSTMIFGGSFIFRGIMAFTGALISILLVWGISKAAGSSKSTVIISGVAVSAMMSAFLNLFITVRPDSVTDKVAFQLGSLQSIPVPLILFMAVVVCICLIISFLLTPGMELFALGDETARGLGLSVKKYRYICILIAGLMAASAVSCCGLISFVGLIIPNLVRRMRTDSGRIRLILCIIWGADLVLAADYFARSIAYPYELPVGMLLSLLGAPFFIFMIITRRKKID